jgi:hypothetical protein
MAALSRCCAAGEDEAVPRGLEEFGMISIFKKLCPLGAGLHYRDGFENPLEPRFDENPAEKGA